MTICFMSHAWGEGGHEFALKLVAVLRTQGLEVWLDETSMHGGEHLAHEMVLGVRHECDVFLFVVSPASLKSSACRTELQEALKRRDIDGLQIIPILFQDQERPFELNELIYEDFQNPDEFSASTSKLLDSIQAASDIHSLVVLLINGDAESRAEAAQVLGNLRNIFTVPPLARSLSSDSSPKVRHWAAYALGRIGTKGAVADLKQANQQETDGFAKLGIEQALRELGCQSTSRPSVPGKS